MRNVQNLKGVTVDDFIVILFFAINMLLGNGVSKINRYKDHFTKITIGGLSFGIVITSFSVLLYKWYYPQQFVIGGILIFALTGYLRHKIHLKVSFIKHNIQSNIDKFVLDLVEQYCDINDVSDKERMKILSEYRRKYNKIKLQPNMVS